MSKHSKYATKLEGQLDKWAKAGHPRHTFIVDPGKFGALAYTAPWGALHAACAALNDTIGATGHVTEADVKAAFQEAGLK